MLDDSSAPVGLAAGQRLGRQSTRNPGCLEAPPLRRAVQGFVWGYCMSPVTHKSGWMLLSELERDPGSEQLACGPAGADSIVACRVHVAVILMVARSLGCVLLRVERW